MTGNRKPHVDAWSDRYDSPRKDLVEGDGNTSRVSGFAGADDLATAAGADVLRVLARAWVATKGG